MTQDGEFNVWWWDALGEAHAELRFVDAKSAAERASSLAHSPKRVRAIQDGWVFVEDHEAGVPMEHIRVVEKGSSSSVKAGTEAPRLPLDPPPPEWREERLLDDDGEEIFIRYKGDPTKARYEFIRDYLDFKLKRLKPKDEATN